VDIHLRELGNIVFYITDLDKNESIYLKLLRLSMQAGPVRLAMPYLEEHGGRLARSGVLCDLLDRVRNGAVAG
jgi:hypothetical protein